MRAVRHIDGHHQDRNRDGNVDRKKDVEHERRQWNDHQTDDKRYASNQDQVAKASQNGVEIACSNLLLHTRQLHKKLSQHTRPETAIRRMSPNE